MRDFHHKCTSIIWHHLIDGAFFHWSLRMIEGYATVKDVSEKWGINPRTVQIMCAEGRIIGATKFGNIWAIPIDAEKPIDNRITSGEYKNWRKRHHRNVAIQ